MGYRNNKNSILIVTIIVMISRLIAFLREFVLSYYYGVSAVTDAYNVAYTIPITIIGFVALALNTSYIPLFNKIKSEECEESAILFSNNITSIVFLISLSLFGLIVIFASSIVKLFASGFDQETLDLSIRLTKYMAATVMLFSFNKIMAAYIQLENKYYIVTICDASVYLFSILGVVASARFGVVFLSLGVLFGFFVESLCLIIVALYSGYHFVPMLCFRDRRIRELLVLVLPVIAGSFASDINKIIDKNIASMYSTGSVSILSYAHKIDEAIISIFLTSIISISYPKISKCVQDRSFEALTDQLFSDFEFLLFLIIPITAGCLVYSNEISTLLFVRGAFTQENAQSVALAFAIYAVGILPTGIRKYFIRIFYSFSDSKTPASNSFVVIGINIILSIILAQFWGIYGVAAGSSISIVIGACMLIFRLRKHIRINYSPVIVPFVKISIATSLMIAVSKVFEKLFLLVVHPNISTLFSITIAVVVYFVSILALRMRHLLQYIKE